MNFNELLSGRLLAKPPLAFTSWSTTKGKGWADITKEHMRSVGGDFYLPIPYAKSCKITLDIQPFYYAFNYRAYAPGTQVETFSTDVLKAAEPVIERVSKTLAEYDGPREGQTLSAKKTLQKDTEMSRDLPAGPNAVRRAGSKNAGGTDARTTPHYDRGNDFRRRADGMVPTIRVLRQRSGAAAPSPIGIAARPPMARCVAAS